MLNTMYLKELPHLNMCEMGKGSLAAQIPPGYDVDLLGMPAVVYLSVEPFTQSYLYDIRIEFNKAPNSSTVVSLNIEEDSFIPTWLEQTKNVMAPGQDIRTWAAAIGLAYTVDDTVYIRVRSGRDEVVNVPYLAETSKAKINCFIWPIDDGESMQPMYMDTPDVHADTWIINARPTEYTERWLFPLIYGNASAEHRAPVSELSETQIATGQVLNPEDCDIVIARVSDGYEIEHNLGHRKALCGSVEYELIRLWLEFYAVTYPISGTIRVREFFGDAYDLKELQVIGDGRVLARCYVNQKVSAVKSFQGNPKQWLTDFGWNDEPERKRFPMQVGPFIPKATLLSTQISFVQPTNLCSSDIVVTFVPRLHELDTITIDHNLMSKELEEGNSVFHLVMDWCRYFDAAHVHGTIWIRERYMDYPKDSLTVPRGAQLCNHVYSLPYPPEPPSLSPPLSIGTNDVRPSAPDVQLIGMSLDVPADTTAQFKVISNRTGLDMQTLLYTALADYVVRNHRV